MPRSIRILLAAVALVLLCAPAWGQGGLVRGTVTDAEGNTLEDVMITVTSETLPTFRETKSSDRKGKFTIRFAQAQHTYDFLFERSGFQSFTQPISPSATKALRETFVMELGQSQAVEKQGDLAAVMTGASNEAVASFNAGLDAQKAGQLEVARGHLEAAIEADAELGPAHVALAQVLLDAKQHEAAIESADRALALAIDRTEALRVKYYALRALGRAEEAEQASAELGAAEDAVNTARRMYNEGSQAFQAGDQDTALAKFEEARQLDPSLQDAHHAVATLLLARGDTAGAIEAAEHSLSLGTEDVRTLRVLYEAYDAAGEVDRLTEIAPRLAAVDPEFGGAKLLEQAGASWNAGETARSVALARQALAIDPTQVKAHYFIGLDHLSRGENAEAKAALETFVAAAPDDPDAATAQEMLGFID